MAGQAFVGMSGWVYAPWRGKFYPKKWVQKRELEYASRRVNSIEVNGTFYGLQKPAAFQSWHDQTPDDFVFSVKAPQFITHVKRLKECREPLATFLGSGLLCLERKLGPILWQFPPNVTLKDDRFERFFEILPHGARAAARLAEVHGRRREGRNFFDVTEDFPIRHAFEFRHPSFNDPRFLGLMRSHGVAIVIAHAGSETAPYIEELTAPDFVYARMHGQGKGYKKGYPDAFLAEWSKKVGSWVLGGRDAFVYFDNEGKDCAPSDAIKLMRKLEIEWEHGLVTAEGAT